MISKGAKPSKLLLGLPMYGHAYLLTEVPRNNYIGLVSDSTFTSPKTKEGGIIAYHEVTLLTLLALETFEHYTIQAT